MHPKKPTHLFGGRLKGGTQSGGVFLSTNSGHIFQPIGLVGVRDAGLAVNGPCTRLLAATYASGIYVSPIPASA
jgi:hypothetical protein